MSGAGSSRARKLVEPVIVVVLYAVGLAVFLYSVATIDKLQVITGEEATVSFVNVIAIPARFQFTDYSTNFGGHLMFLIWSYLDPDLDLFYGRRWKAVTMALLGPLVYLTLRRRLGCGRLASATGAVAVLLLPGVYAFSWLATENGLEAVWGTAGLLVATSRRRLWWAAPVLAGVAVSTYGAGLGWAAGICAVVAVRVLRSRRRWADGVRALGAVAAGAVVVVFPRWWWPGGGKIVTGGGSVDPGNAGVALRALLDEALVRGNSYYYATTQPALGSAALAAVAVAGLAMALWRRPVVWPWVVVALATILMYLLSGGVLGIRRAIALPIVAAIGVGLASDLATGWLRARRRWLGTLARAVLCLAVVVPLGLGYAGWIEGWSAGRQRLAMDFAFPVVPGRTMVQTVDLIGDRLSTGRVDADTVVRIWEGERTLAMVRLLAERNGRDLHPLPDGADIARLYREGPRCARDCLPVPGRR